MTSCRSHDKFVQPIKVINIIKIDDFRGFLCKMDLLSPECLLRIFENIFITKNGDDHKTLLTVPFRN